MVKNKCSPISKAISDKLKKISPNALNYYPCKVTLRGGKEVDYVYLVDLKDYLKTWGRYPEENKGKNFVDVRDVEEIEESPSRLPYSIVNKLNAAGETGMGYITAIYIFNDGSKEVLINAYDFINYPSGKSKDDIIDVIPHQGQNDPNLKSGPVVSYCVYS